MSKKYLILILILFSINILPYYIKVNADEKDAIWNTGKDDISHMKAKNSDYKKGRDALKQAMRYDKKGKINKANKRFNDAINFFTLAFEESPEDTDIINHLGFCLKKIEDFIMAEVYYSQGLDIDPSHKEINEYLGYLYIETNRIDKAKERLKVLEDCECDEFDRLKVAIKKGETKY